MKFFLPISLLNITGNNIPIDSVDTIKYLGLYVDKHLSFDSHVDNIVKKVSQRNRLLWKMRNFIPESLAKYLYTTLIAPIFNYCDFIYDGTSNYNKQKLQVMQNASLRAVKRTKLEYPVKRLHDELEIDFLGDIRKKSTIKLVYRGVNNMGPEFLNNNFNEYVPNRPLRSASKCQVAVPKTKLHFSDRDICVRGGIYWNDTSEIYTKSDSLEILKTRLKKYGEI